VFLFTLNNKKEALTAFDAVTGHILWTDELPAGWTGDYAGTRATPAVAGGAVYTYGGAGDLVCRDAQTGKPRWRADVLQLTGSGNLGWGASSSPLVANGLVYVQGGTGGSVAVAVRADDGKVAWQSEARGKGGYAQPVLADVAGTPRLIVFAGDAIIGMDPGSGRTIWSQPWSTSYDVNASTPVYSDGYLFVTSSYGHGCMMLRVTPTGAEKAWANKEVKSKFQQTILNGGLLYANSDGILKCLSWPDGAVRWKAAKEDVPLGEHGSFVRAAGDKLVVLSDEGEVMLLRATPEGVSKAGQFRAVEGSRVWATPLLYAGRLYVKGPKELVCFDLSAGTPAVGTTTGPTTRP
jgi:outer membrane protein assembly factor BamB